MRKIKKAVRIAASKLVKNGIFMILIMQQALDKGPILLALREIFSLSPAFVLNPTEPEPTLSKPPNHCIASKFKRMVPPTQTRSLEPVGTSKKQKALESVDPVGSHMSFIRNRLTFHQPTAKQKRVRKPTKPPDQGVVAREATPRPFSAGQDHQDVGSSSL